MLYRAFRTVFAVMYMGHIGDNRVYVGVLKGRRVSLQKHAYLGCTIDHTFRILSTLVFISAGHYPYYGSPDFRIIKSFSARVFRPGFFQGYLPKNIGRMKMKGHPNGRIH